MFHVTVVFSLLRVYMGIVLNYCQYGVLYLGSHYNTGPYINVPHFANSNLGKLPHDLQLRVDGLQCRIEGRGFRLYGLRRRLMLLRTIAVKSLEIFVKP